MTLRTSPLIAWLVAPLFILSGCAASHEASFDGPVYPTDAPKLETLNIQVEQLETSIVVTSGEARSFSGPAELWINRWFATTIDALPRGERLEIPLERFKNEYGLPPRGGGFFATRDRDEIVLVELRTPEGLHGLLVVGDRE